MWTPEYFVRYTEFPRPIEAVTLPNDDGTFDIYINSLLPMCVQQAKLEHEVCHIVKDHFYSEKPVAVCESEANGATMDGRLPNIFADRPPKAIPFFNSLDIFKQYMFAMREQYRREYAASDVSNSDTSLRI